MSKSYFSQCPRCGARSLETLNTYSHCVECLYVEDNHTDFETLYHQAIRVEREIESAKVIELPKKTKLKKGEAS